MPGLQGNCEGTWPVLFGASQGMKGEQVIFSSSSESPALHILPFRKNNVASLTFTQIAGQLSKAFKLQHHCLFTYGSLRVNSVLLSKYEKEKASTCSPAAQSGLAREGPALACAAPPPL